jgi:hypothetical protein
MTTQDNAFRAIGTGNPHVNFFAIQATIRNRLRYGASSPGTTASELVARLAALHTALKATAATPTTKGRLGQIIMPIRVTPACLVRGQT